MENMKRRIILCYVGLVVTIAALFGLSCLFFAYGEPKTISFGSGESALWMQVNENVRLSRIALVDEPADLDLFYNGSIHHVRIFDVRERLAIALYQITQGNFGQAISVKMGVGDLILTNLPYAGYTLVPVVIGSLLAAFLPKLPIPKSIALWLGILLLAGSHAFHLVPQPWAMHLGNALLGLALIALGKVWFATQGWKHKLSTLLALLFLGGANLVLFGAYAPSTERGLSSLLWYGFYNGDTHLFPVVGFFLAAGLVLPLFLSLFFRALAKEGTAKGIPAKSHM